MPVVSPFPCPTALWQPSYATFHGKARHPEYYFDDGNLIIRVEDTFYNIFRSSLTRHSTVFKDVLSLPNLQNGAQREGSSDEEPFYLEGIARKDFDCLLSIIYPSAFGVYKLASVEEWTSVLRLATQWDFTDIRTLAVSQLQLYPMDALDKIALSQQYDIHGRWILEAYTQICQRVQPLSVAEAQRVGLETTAKIAQIRERLRGRIYKPTTKKRMSSESSRSSSGSRSASPHPGHAAAASHDQLSGPRIPALITGLRERRLPNTVHGASNPRLAGASKPLRHPGDGEAGDGGLAVRGRCLPPWPLGFDLDAVRLAAAAFGLHQE